MRSSSSNAGGVPRASKVTRRTACPAFAQEFASVIATRSAPPARLLR
jgi:hypothetical protein